MDYTRHLARIKLQETARQRDRLRRQYDAIEASVAQAGSPLDRLRALHAGLKAVTFARRPLHPEVRALDALFLADHLGTVPPELVLDRTRFLERELAQGRLRADFTYAFGRILSEWLDRPSPLPTPPAEEPFPLLWQPAPPPDSAYLDPLFADLAGVLEPIRKASATAGDEILRPTRSEELDAILEQVARIPNRSAAIRRQAAAVQRSQTQRTEVAGVLTILLNGLDDWSWPGEPTPLRTEWMRQKLRPVLDTDLITLLFLELVGHRWTQRLRMVLPWCHLREGQVAAIPNEPEDSLAARIHEVRLSDQESRLFSAINTIPGPGMSQGEAEGGYQSYELLDLLLTVEAEVRFRRAAYPDAATVVGQVDLRDFYPSLSHELMLAVLRTLGVPTRWVEFLGRFLRPSVAHRGTTRTVERGLLLEFTLSDFLAECVLWFLDLAILRRHNVQPIRVVDDLWFVTDSSAKAEAVVGEVTAFCHATGLAVNESKSGHVVIGSPDDSSRPRWGLLRLQPDATWAVDEPALASIEANLRAELAACPSVLGVVAAYNRTLGVVRQQLAVQVALTGEHLRRMGQRLQRTHENLFAANHGIVEEIGRRLEQALPHALLYWPITAGGLALEQPVLQLAGYLEQAEQTKPPPTPDREMVAAYLFHRRMDVRKEPLTSHEVAQLSVATSEKPGGIVTRRMLDEYRTAHILGEDPALPDEAEIVSALASLWRQFYVSSVRVLTPSDPPPLPAMERLVDDFIARGREVSGSHQHSLSAYWRWVVYAYGPSLLEALGTFRFLLTELVPLQLILENRGLMAETESPRPPEPPPMPVSDVIPF